MTEQDERAEQLHAAAALRNSTSTPPPMPSMTAWGRRAALIYLVVGALALAGMAVETVLGHPGTGTMFAAFLSVPWSMLVAGFAPQLPRDWPLAAGLAVRMAPLALFMLLNAAIVAGIAARSERDLTGRGAKALLIIVIAGALASGCALSSRQSVLVAAPSSETVVINGGVVNLILVFDLVTVPEWRDHHSSLHDVTDLSLMGDFNNPNGIGVSVPAADVSIWVNGQGLLAIDPATATQVWGPLHVEPDETHRVGWDEGARRFNANKDALRREVMGDGQFTLRVASVLPPGSQGGAAVDNFRLGATLQVK